MGTVWIRQKLYAYICDFACVHISMNTHIIQDAPIQILVKDVTKYMNVDT